MNYALILDNNQYQFVKLITTEKNTAWYNYLSKLLTKKLKMII